MLQPVFQEIIRGPQRSYVEIVGRPMGPLISAGMIGTERESQSRPAGLRTHILISLTACVHALIVISHLRLAEKKAGTYRKTHADVSQQAERENG